MKALSLLSALALLLTVFAFTANADERPERPGRCTGYPNQEFNLRLNGNLRALVNSVQCNDLRSAMLITRQLQMEISREIEKSTTEYGECYEDAKCEKRSSQSTPTKDMCKASDGKSWKKTNPLPVGACVKL